MPSPQGLAFMVPECAMQASTGKQSKVLPNYDIYETITTSDYHDNTLEAIV